MPAIQTDGSAFQDESAFAEEQAKVEQAKADLIDEQEQSSGYLGGKYQTAEDLENAYRSLQAEYTRVTQAQRGEVQQQADDSNDEEEVDTPQITTEQLESLRTKMFDQVGGANKYRALTAWAADNIDADRAQQYDEALQSANESQVMTALKSIQYDYMQANGYEPKLTGGSAPSNEVRGFASEAQVVEAMSDPRYSGPNADPAYQKQVESMILANDRLFSTK